MCDSIRINLNNPTETMQTTQEKGIELINNLLNDEQKSPLTANQADALKIAMEPMLEALKVYDSGLRTAKADLVPGDEFQYARATFQIKKHGRTTSWAKAFKLAIVEVPAEIRAAINATVEEELTKVTTKVVRV